ncbi:MAG: hypothetical protein AAFQ88_03000 [Pseudomonadota bacterium]
MEGKATAIGVEQRGWPEIDVGPSYSAIAATRRRFGWAVTGFLLCVGLPTLLGAWYWGSVAADRYVSTVHYAIRGGAAPEGVEGSGSLGAPGMVSARADAFILEDFLRSPAALAALEAQLDLRSMLARDGDDPVRRFDPAMPAEGLLAYWNGALDLRFDMLTGITQLEVRLFRAEDSLTVADALVDILRRLVDRLSERQQTDMLRYVEQEFRAADMRLRNSLDAIERFRRRTLTVSPTQEAALNSATIARLTEELTGLSVRLRTLQETVPNSPQIPRLREQMAALRAQIASTRARVGGAGDPGRVAAADQSETGQALPHQLTTFERLQNEYEIALDSYVTTLGLRQKAQAAATLDRAHLVVFVPPQRATTPTAPHRLGAIALVAGIAFLAWVMGRVLLASLRTP